MGIRDRVRSTAAKETSEGFFDKATIEEAKKLKEEAEKLALEQKGVDDENGDITTIESDVVVNVVVDSTKQVAEQTTQQITQQGTHGKTEDDTHGVIEGNRSSETDDNTGDDSGDTTDNLKDKTPKTPSNTTDSNMEIDGTKKKAKTFYLYSYIAEDLEAIPTKYGIPSNELLGDLIDEAYTTEDLFTNLSDYLVKKEEENKKTVRRNAEGKFEVKKPLDTKVKNKNLTLSITNLNRIDELTEKFVVSKSSTIKNKSNLLNLLIEYLLENIK